MSLEIYLTRKDLFNHIPELVKDKLYKTKAQFVVFKTLNPVIQIAPLINKLLNVFNYKCVNLMKISPSLYDFSLLMLVLHYFPLELLVCQQPVCIFCVYVCV